MRGGVVASLTVMTKTNKLYDATLILTQASLGTWRSCSMGLCLSHGLPCAVDKGQLAVVRLSYPDYSFEDKTNPADSCTFIRYR